MEDVKLTITTNDLVKTISRRTGLTQKDVSRVLDAFFIAVSSELAKDNIILLRGFGKFFNTLHSGRVINPVGGGSVVIAPHLVTNFKISRPLKKRINRHSCHEACSV